MGVSIYKKRGFLLNIKKCYILTYFGFLQYYKTPSFEENENKHQDCHKNTIFHQKKYFSEFKKLAKEYLQLKLKKMP